MAGINMRDKAKTKHGVVQTIYNTQLRNSKKRGHRPPEYTLGELYDWVKCQPSFNSMYNEWVKSDYDTDLKPSVDRILDSVHYCFGNIQLMTWYENNIKAREDRKSGRSISIQHKTVYQYTKDMEFIMDYHSVAQAGRCTGIKKSGIANCCRGDVKSAGGFIFSYEKLGEV